MEISTNEVSCCGEPKTMMWCLLQTGCNKARVSDGRGERRWKVGIVTLFQVFQDRFFGLHFILSISASNASMSVRWICKKQKFVVRYPITEKNRSIHKLYIYIKKINNLIHIFQLQLDQTLIIAPSISAMNSSFRGYFFQFCRITDLKLPL